jgi:lactoylglutathione lyase
MRTLHVGLRVSDRHRSLTFYQALGYEVVGTVPATPFGHLTMLKLPDDEFVTIELVTDPPTDRAGEDPRLSHLVINVESMDATVGDIATRGIYTDEPTAPQDPNEIQNPNELRTSWITDPDGNRIELVQWPAGHPEGMSAVDWPDQVAGPEGELT